MTAKITCTRVLAFDAAHRVLRHESKCATLHGHRYTVEITCEANHLDRVGRVIDFGKVKEYVGTWIDNHWDHTTLVNRADTVLMDMVCADSRDNGKRPPYIFSGEPTAENIATELLAIATELLSKTGIRVAHVRVYETPNCWADAFAEPNRP
jgi:6-pyruvoyltetrahydropterin/6-carboxytetrahydropterin synthase